MPQTEPQELPPLRILSPDEFYEAEALVVAWQRLTPHWKARGAEALLAKFEQLLSRSND